MLKKTSIYAAVVALFMAGFTGRAELQDRTLVTGLETDSTYMTLVAEEERLKEKEDSLGAEVATTRGLFRSDTENRQKYTDDIIRLEGEIFDIRNRIGIVAGKINAIEQEFIIRNLSSGGGQPRGRGGESLDEYPETSPVLVLNPLFERNLHGEDYRNLIEAQRMEAAVVDDISTFAANYGDIRKLAAANDEAATAGEADSIYSAYRTLAGLNGMLSEKIDRDFGFVYDNKLYCYNYILDKLGRRSQLAAFEKKITEARDRSLTASDGAMSAAVASYPHRKALLLEYEEALARMAGYDDSYDSLRKAETALSAMNFGFPEIAFEEKLFLDYADIEFHSPPKYNSRTPVPDLIVHPRGEIYRILLGTYPRVQAVSILKGAYPVGVLKEEGRFSYYAGGYPSVEEAARAMETLSGKGFRDLKVGRWTDGRLEVLTQGDVDRALGRTTEGLFRLSIDTGGKPLPQVIKEIVEDIAPGAEISRSGELYIIGVFDSREDAMDAADEIGDTTPEVTVKIESVG